MSDINDDTSHYNGALLEDIDHKLAAILEGQQAMSDMPEKLNRIDERLFRVETDVKAIKAAFKDQTRQFNAQFKEHDGRITKLEQSAV